MKRPGTLATPDRKDAAGRESTEIGQWWLVLLMWALVFAVLFMVQAFASRSPHLVDGWVQFDGPEYLSIVRDGYQQRQLVWFPLLPLLIEAASWVITDPTSAAVSVSALGGLASALWFWIWTGSKQLSPASRLVGLCVLLLYPYGWFLYGVVYPDALFLAFALGAFVMLEGGRIWVSALLGAFASAARPSGFAVVVGLLVLSFERTGFLTVPDDGGSWVRELRLPLRIATERWKLRSLVPGLSVFGLLSYMLYQWIAWGSPIRFVSEQANYHERSTASLLKQQYFDAWSQGFDGRHLATTTAQAVILVVVLGSVPAVGRRFGWGYGAYVLSLAALPLVSVSTFMGVGRYLLPAFPCFALFGEWLSHRRAIALGWFAVATVALVVMSFGFARSWYLT